MSLNTALRRILLDIAGAAITGPAKGLAASGVTVGAWLEAKSGLDAFTRGGTPRTAWDGYFDAWPSVGNAPSSGSPYLDGTFQAVTGDRPVNRQRQAGNTGQVAFTSGTPVNVADTFAQAPIRGVGGGTRFYFCIAFDTGLTDGYYMSIMGDAAAASNNGWHLYWDADQTTPLRLSVGNGTTRSFAGMTLPGWSQFAFWPIPLTRIVLEGYYDGTNIGLRRNKGTWVTTALASMAAGQADVYHNPQPTGISGGGYFAGEYPFIYVLKGGVPDSATQDAIADYAQATFGGSLWSNAQNYESIADPAVFAISVPNTGDSTGVFSNALPATTGISTGVSTKAVIGTVSIANPATYAFNAAAATAIINKVYTSVADPAVFTLTTPAATGQQTLSSVALAATIAYTPAAATSIVNRPSVALPATFAVSAFPTTNTIGQNVISVALPATFLVSATATNVRRTHFSQANPAAFFLNPLATGDEHTGEEEKVVFESPPPAAELTEIEFLDWLKDETAIRVILVETQCIDSNGNVQQLYLGSTGFVTKIEDGQVNAHYYLPLMRGGLDFEQSVDLELKGQLSYGDIELDNEEGDLDWMFERHWQYQPLKAFVGDARWPRRDFRQIFDGAIEDIDSSARNTVNVRLRDKLYRLEMPLHEEKVGGTGPDADKLVPVCFGEVHNMTPVLKDPNTLTYVYHVRQAETVFEVRDNGVPVQRITSDSVPASFTLPNQPYGRVTCSVQGDYDGRDFGYRVDVGGLVWRIATLWGTEPTKRFSESDMDGENFNEFVMNHSQAVGLLAVERMTCLEACQQIAAAVGARLTMTALGKLQLIKVQVPPFGTPIDVDESDMVDGSLHIATRLPLIASIRLGYCKNWTVQEDTAAGVPEEHKAMFAREWYSTVMVNPVTRDTYNLWGEAEQENCHLLQKNDADAEAGRRLWLRSTQRHVYQFTGFADLILTPVGAPMRITHRRFGLSQGKVGQVVGVAVNWLTSQVTIRVLI